MEVVIVATKKNEEGVGVEKVMVRGVLFPKACQIKETFSDRVKYNENRTCHKLNCILPKFK